MTVAEHTPPHRTKDTVSDCTHPLAVRPFVGNRTDGAIGFDSVKRWIGIRCHVAHGMSHNSVRCFCIGNSNQYLSGPSHIAAPGSCQIVGEFRSKPETASADLG